MTPDDLLDCIEQGAPIDKVQGQVLGWTVRWIKEALRQVSVCPAACHMCKSISSGSLEQMSTEVDEIIEMGVLSELL